MFHPYLVTSLIRRQMRVTGLRFGLVCARGFIEVLSKSQLKLLNYSVNSFVGLDLPVKESH